MSVLIPIIELFRYGLEPVAPFSWFGINLNTLDIVAAVRLCMVLRQIREMIAKSYQTRAKAQPADEKATGGGPRPMIETKSLVRDMSATLLVVHGGEFAAPFLGVPPSFLVSGTYPILYAATQAAIEYLPTVPEVSLQLELPLSLLDALTRTISLVNGVPSVVLNSPFSQAATSPWTLLLTSFVTINAGFFAVNMLSFLHPTPLTLTTPTELLPYGWTTTDLWSAPLITGLYALLTHAQPFWANAHASILGWIGSTSGKEMEPVDYETARAACAVVLMVLFSTRAINNFGGLQKK